MGGGQHEVDDDDVGPPAAHGGHPAGTVAAGIRSGDESHPSRMRAR